MSRTELLVGQPKTALFGARSGVFPGKERIP